jgi:MFS family permease
MTTVPFPRLGLRENAAQFALLVGVNGLVGGMIGQERTVLPLMAREIFGLTAFTAVLSFVLAFGVTKALSNLAAGALADRYGRKPVLVAGWLFGLPVPLLLIWAPEWSWIIVANVLLGINQGLAWSSTVIMKIDLVGPSRRGLAMGLNEAAGYGAVALTALATGFIAAQAGLRPAPFFLGLAFAGLGLGVSVLFVRETKGHVALETSTKPDLPWRTVFARTTFRDPSLSAASQAGLVNNLNDGMAWGLLPLFYASHGLTIAEVGILAAAYPAVWGLGQIGTGALSDRIGRKGLIVGGMLLQAAAIALIAASSTFAVWLLAAALLGLGSGSRRLPIVAGPRLRGGSHGRRGSCRPGRHALRDQCHRGAYGRVRLARPRPNARDASELTTSPLFAEPSAFFASAGGFFGDGLGVFRSIVGLLPHRPVRRRWRHFSGARWDGFLTVTGTIPPGSIENCAPRKKVMDHQHNLRSP